MFMMKISKDKTKLFSLKIQDEHGIRRRICFLEEKHPLFLHSTNDETNKRIKVDNYKLVIGYILV